MAVRPTRKRDLPRGRGSADRIPTLAERYQRPLDYSPRTGDYRLLTVFRCRHGDAVLMFRAYAYTRPLLRSYPGLTRHLELFNSSNCRIRNKTDLLGVAEGWLLGDEIDPLPLPIQLGLIFTNACSNQHCRSTTRCTTVSRNCVPAMRTSVPSIVLVPTMNSPTQTIPGGLVEPRATSEDWQEELEQPEEQLEAQAQPALNARGRR